jgi:hypothetical protein
MAERKPQALKYKAHVLHFRCGTILISSPITQILAHTWCWLVDGGQNQFSASNMFFFKQMKFEEYGKNKQNIPRG